ncbi:histidine phosphatase family protein [bacterium AH-315-I18]|nr:histidine phosphatase family protein [bacterium AH-315-I18]
MQITLFRHGIAQNCDDVLDDADRQLTPKGIKRTKLSAIGLANCCKDANLILTSPKIRARQTAEIAADVLQLPIQIEQSLSQRNLAPIIGAIQQMDQKHIILVGHEPTFTELAQYLCGQESLDTWAKGQEVFLTLKKAGALSLEVDRRGARLSPGARLLWLLPPSLLGSLGKPMID